MLKLKKSLILSILVILTSQFVLADCISDCKKVTDAADKVIAEQKKELDLYKQKDLAQNNMIVDLNVQLSEKDAALQAWYHNPFIVGALGLFVGGATVLYLRR